MLLSTTLQKRGPADGNLAILDDICQQVPVIKHTKGTRKNPLKTGKIPKYNIITSKKFGKTLGKRLLPESNRSWRQTPGGQIF